MCYHETWRFEKWIKKLKKDQVFWQVMFVFLFLIFAMAAQIFIIKNNDIAHITLLGVTVVTVVVAFISGFTWEDIQGGICMELI